jgi:AcrR family transcriptional regulator
MSRPVKSKHEIQEEARSANRDAMLDAAEEVVVREGIGRLTLDAVAREANLSKGGLLHHFPSKDALIDALVERKLGNWECGYEAAIEQQPPGPGRIPRAFLNMCLASTGKWTDAMRRSSAVLVAALVHDASRVEPLKKMRQDLWARIAEDGLPSGVGEAVLLAVDGLWFDWIFGLTELTPQKLSAVRAALQRLVEQSCAAGNAGAASSAVKPCCSESSSSIETGEV